MTFSARIYVYGREKWGNAASVSAPLRMEFFMPRARAAEAAEVVGIESAEADRLEGTMQNATWKSAQTLLIDADDTLWENNIYFERAIAGFISYLNHQEYSPTEVRERLNEVEREHTSQHGYGVASFRRSLVTCFERLSLERI